VPRQNDPLFHFALIQLDAQIVDRQVEVEFNECGQREMEKRVKRS